MRVFLIHPCFYKESHKGYRMPLGLSSLASYIKRDSHEVLCFDMNYPLSKIPDRYLKKDQELIGIVKDFQPDIIGFSCYTLTRYNTYFWAKLLKEELPATRIVIGGPHASFNAKVILEKYRFIDYIVLFEGEIPFARLLNALANETSLARVPNLAYRNQINEVITNQEQAYITDLDSLPIAERECFVNAKELIMAGQAVDFRFDIFPDPVIHIMTSRGCPNRCKFCSSAHFWKGNVRFRSPESIIAELKDLKSKYPEIKNLVFHDDIISTDGSRLERLCDLMIQNDLDYRWAAWCHFNILNKNLLQMMQKAGCRQLKLGIESANQESLNHIGKNSNLKDIREKINWINETGIVGTYSFILDLPFETKLESKKTLNFIKETGVEWRNLRPNIHTLIFPGTALFHEYINKMGEFDWENPPEEIKKDMRVDTLGNPLLPLLGTKYKSYDEVQFNLYFPEMSRYAINGNKKGKFVYNRYYDFSFALTLYRYIDTRIIKKAVTGDNTLKILIISTNALLDCLAAEYAGLGHEVTYLDAERDINKAYTSLKLSRFENDYFDLIISSDFILLKEDLKRIPRYLYNELKRVVKKEGIISFFMINSAHIRNRIQFFITGKYNHAFLIEEAIQPFNLFMNNLKMNNMNVVRCIGFGIIFKNCSHKRIAREVKTSSLPLPPGLSYNTLIICNK